MSPVHLNEAEENVKRLLDEIYPFIMAF